MYVYFGFCHAATRCTLQLAATTTETECIKKKNKKPEKQEPTQNHYPFSVSLLFVKKKKNHPESPGKNHVTYPRKAVPVITGYGFSTSLLLRTAATTADAAADAAVCCHGFLKDGLPEATHNHYERK